MTTSRFNSIEIGFVAGATCVLTGIGAGTSAAIRGSSIAESASIVGIGTGLLTAGVGFFAKKEPKPPFTKAIKGLAILELAGTTIGYIGTKLFVNAAASTSPFIDATLGFPITIGVVYCFGVLANHYHQNTLKSNLRPHSR